MDEKLQGVSDRLNMCTATLLALHAMTKAQARAKPGCCKSQLTQIKTAKSYIRLALEQVTMLLTGEDELEDEVPFE